MGLPLPHLTEVHCGQYRPLKCLKRQAILSAVKQAIQQEADYTDDCQLMEQLGNQVHLCMGSYENIKLTTKEDLSVAQAILNQRNTERSNS